MSPLARRLRAVALALPVALLGGAVWVYVGLAHFFADENCFTAGDCRDNPTAREWSQLEWLSSAAGLAGLVVLAAVALRRRNMAIAGFAVVLGGVFGVFWLLARPGDSPAAWAVVLAALACGSIGIALTPRRT